MAAELVLTDTAKRMMDNLPDYYQGNPLVERYIQAQANEIDRIDAVLDAIEAGLVPATADDSQGFLSAWEAYFELPVAPAGVPEATRLQLLLAQFARLDANSSKSWVDTITAAIGAGWSYQRNTPAQLEDEITISYASGTYTATQVKALVDKLHPAHRLIVMRYVEGFIFDVSRLDEDAF